MGDSLRFRCGDKKLARTLIDGTLKFLQLGLDLENFSIRAGLRNFRHRLEKFLSPIN